MSATTAAPKKKSASAKTAPDGQKLFSDIAADPGWSGRVLQAAATREPLCRMTMGIAHEVNNLIGGISAMSEIYLQGMGSAMPLQDGMGLIHKSAGRLQTLVRQLVELSRPPDGEQTYVGIVEFVRAQIELYRHILPKGTHVEADLPEEELAVKLDETAFRQLLLNLVVNIQDIAGKANPSEDIGPVAMRLRALPDASQVELIVSPRPPADASADTANDGLLAAQRQDMRLRLLDARRSLQSLGGELLVRDGGEVVLTLPLVTF